MFVAAIASVACHHGGASVRGGIGEPTWSDSLQGTVTMVGVDALPRAMLALDDGSPAITLVAGTALQLIAGLRVTVFGSRLGAQFTVAKFIVVAANGVPAVDGTLVADGDALSIVTADGTRRGIVRPSPALRAAVGHRVWLSGSLDHPPVAYGIIE